MRFRCSIHLLSCPHVLLFNLAVTTRTSMLFLPSGQAAFNLTFHTIHAVDRNLLHLWDAALS